MDLKRPIILVTINYRVNCLGFFGSDELKREAEEDGETYSPNLGLLDQRNAFLWVCAQWSPYSDTYFN